MAHPPLRAMMRYRMRRHRHPGRTRGRSHPRPFPRFPTWSGSVESISPSVKALMPLAIITEKITKPLGGIHVSIVIIA